MGGTAMGVIADTGVLDDVKEGGNRGPRRPSGRH